MSSLQEQIEEMGGRDALSADGYIVCTDESKKGRIMATAVLHQPYVRRLTHMQRTFSHAVSFRSEDVGFSISDYKPKSRCLITLEAPEKDFVPLFTSFLEYLRQSQLLVNPIISCKFSRAH